MWEERCRLKYRSVKNAIIKGRFSLRQIVAIKNVVSRQQSKVSPHAARWVDVPLDHPPGLRPHLPPRKRDTVSAWARRGATVCWKFAPL